MIPGTSFLNQRCRILLIRESQTLILLTKKLLRFGHKARQSFHVQQILHFPEALCSLHTCKLITSCLSDSQNHYVYIHYPHIQINLYPRGFQERESLGSCWVNELISCACGVSKVTLVPLLQNITILFVLFPDFLHQWTALAHDTGSCSQTISNNIWWVNNNTFFLITFSE